MLLRRCTGGGVSARVSLRAHRRHFDHSRPQNFLPVSKKNLPPPRFKKLAANPSFKTTLSPTPFKKKHKNNTLHQPVVLIARICASFGSGSTGRSRRKRRRSWSSWSRSRRSPPSTTNTLGPDGGCKTRVSPAWVLYPVSMLCAFYFWSLGEERRECCSLYDRPLK